VRKKIADIISTKKWMKNFAVLFSFVLPIAMLYGLYPNSFLYTWRARYQYIIFLWLFFIELALAWRKLQPKLGLSHRTRTLITLVVMIIPTSYVVATSFFGLSSAVVALGKLVGVPYKTFGDFLVQEAWPVTFEYIVFTSSFTAIIFFAYTRDGLRKILIAPFFLWATTFFTLIDNLAPYGVIWILQAFVPFIARSSATVLGWLGYRTITGSVADGAGPGVTLVALGNGSVFGVIIYWPSAGIQSLFIYTVTILLFIKNVSFSLWRKIICVSVGAVGTFIANVLRIVTICIIGLKIGGAAAAHFHDYYGEFFFISWMLIYLAIIAFGPRLLQKMLKAKSLKRRLNLCPIL
jgi:exosortase/archaeosortase family protein